MEEQVRAFQNNLMKFLAENNVRIFKLNDKSFIDKQNAYAAIIGLCDEILRKGDIRGTYFNIKKYNQYVEANKIGFALFENPTSIEMECGPNWSFATTTIKCSYFGFDIESIKKNNKDQFQAFVNLIDFIEVSPGIEKNTIRVNFAVNDVWSE